MNKKSTLGEVANNYLAHTHTANGITLIALVITIIVMMILVGVTVRIATTGGLFDYAGKASDLQRAGMVEEHVNVWKSEKLMAKHSGGEVKTTAELLDDLYEQNLITKNEQKEANSTGTIKIRDKEISLGLEKVTPQKIDDWTWEVDAKTNTITITGYHGTDTTVTIPNFINNVRVTKIQGKEKRASASTDTQGYYYSKSIWERQICTDRYYVSLKSAMNETVKKVIIPEGIEEIASNAFECSIVLEEIDISSTVNTIGDLVFYGCASLKNITIPQTVKKMGECVFAWCGWNENGTFINQNGGKITVTVPYKKENLPTGWNQYWCGQTTFNKSYSINVNYAG